MLTNWSISLNTPRTPVATSVDRTCQPLLPHPEAARWRKRDLGVGGRPRLAWRSRRRLCCRFASREPAERLGAMLAEVPKLRLRKLTANARRDCKFHRQIS